MAENFFVVFDRREQTGKQVSPSGKYEKAELLGPKVAAPVSSGQIEDACVLLVSAENVAEAQMVVRHFYPGLSNGTAVAIKEAAFKES